MIKVKKIVWTTGILAFGLMLVACGRSKLVDKPDTGELTAPEADFKVDGIVAKFDDGTIMLISESNGPIVLTAGEKLDLSKLETGDNISIYCNVILETYPAQTTVSEMIFHEKGSVADISTEVLENLKGMGYEMKDSLPPGESYTSIKMQEAEEIFKDAGDYIILDVRTADEFAEGHIPGAINYANEDIGDENPEVLPDMRQTIYVYCRSGNRSKQAAKKLAGLGYINIIECGGIIDWSGEIEK